MDFSRAVICLSQNVIRVNWAFRIFIHTASSKTSQTVPIPRAKCRFVRSKSVNTFLAYRKYFLDIQENVYFQI